YKVHDNPPIHKENSMQMLFVDTNAVVMHLIEQAKKVPVKDLEYVHSKSCQSVSIRINESSNDHWVATISIDVESEYKFPNGTVVLKKNGYPEIKGLFSRHRTPLLFEYARDFCIRVGEGEEFSETKKLLKEALPDLRLP
ncbi:MAG: hypothetical protein AAB972_02680, partial [Patescibacteria group bacterium]